jgi:hypothetical protein
LTAQRTSVLHASAPATHSMWLDISSPTVSDVVDTLVSGNEEIAAQAEDGDDNDDDNNKDDGNNQDDDEDNDNDNVGAPSEK